jgi:hypothetical protein
MGVRRIEGKGEDGGGCIEWGRSYEGLELVGVERGGNEGIEGVVWKKLQVFRANE